MENGARSRINGERSKKCGVRRLNFANSEHLCESREGDQDAFEKKPSGPQHHTCSTPSCYFPVIFSLEL
jgi:hypothetical protein